MDTSTIRSEILRLQPWYYLFDLNGVCTDIAEPCQSLGHIKIDVGALGEIFAGKRVLDVGCNEGAWSFGAIDRGADSVVAFDCRDRNIEKAEFVKGVLGYEKVDFSVASIGVCTALKGTYAKNAALRFCLMKRTASRAMASVK